jgi:S-adenosylmethionine-diacylglycerol 3-amino-3-carboxypropyl transferase
MSELSADVARRVSFEAIRYANCWEDSALLMDVLRPAEGRRILSIASAGDNSLHMLSKGAEVIAVDLNPTQLACVELRVQAIRQRDDHDALAFLGFYPSESRLETYQALRDALSLSARHFWDCHPSLISGGIIHAGKFENYFRLFRSRLLPLVHGRRTVMALMEARDQAGRTRFYDEVWNNRRWRWLFTFFFSRFMMGRLGRDPEFFRYVEGSVADRILQRTRYALTELETHTNPYLRYVLTGSFEGAMPDWTQPAVLDGIRQYADRLTLFHGGVEAAADQYGADGFDGYNLSDIFEYMDEEKGAQLYGHLVERARIGARVAYWNMLVPRRRPIRYAREVDELTTLANDGFARDRAFFYSAFRVDEVLSAVSASGHHVEEGKRDAV